MLKDEQNNGTARGGSSGGGRGTTGAGKAGESATTETAQGSVGTSRSAAARTAAKPVQRTTGLIIRKESHRKISGKVTEGRGLELDDYLAYCLELEGRAPDMDTVLENALAALFRCAKGFGSWRKNRPLEQELDAAFDQFLVPPQPASSPASSTGAS